MRRKQINTSEEKYRKEEKSLKKYTKALLGFMSIKKKVIISGVALHDDIAESISNMVDAGKSRMEDFRPN